MGQVQSQMQQAAADQAVNAAGEQLAQRWPQCKYLTTVRTIVGIVLVFFAWSAFTANIGFDIVKAIILFFLACICTLLEFSFIIGKLTCCSAEGIFCKGWHFFLQLDGWKRGIFYFVSAILVFIPMPLLPGFWAVILGLVLITSGILYVAKAFQFVTAPTQTQSAPGNLGSTATTPSGGGMRDPSQFSRIP